MLGVHDPSQRRLPCSIRQDPKGLAAASRVRLWRVVVTSRTDWCIARLATAPRQAVEVRFHVVCECLGFRFLLHSRCAAPEPGRLQGGPCCDAHERPLRRNHRDDAFRAAFHRLSLPHKSRGR